MTLKKSLKTTFNSIFQKRSVIVMSSKGTHHVSLSARKQMLLLTTVIAVVGWGSYSTGKYMAARDVMASQDETLNTLANSHVQRSFSFLPPTLSPNERMAATSAQGDSSFGGLSSMDQDKMMARIAYLEGRERELMKQNDQIMITVRDKVKGQIANLEDVIRATGLEPAQLAKDTPRKPSKDEVLEEDNAALTPSQTGAKGGPLVPEGGKLNNPLKSFDREMSQSVQQIETLKSVLRILPLVAPVKQASLESSFGGRVDPFTGRMAFHAGVDLAAPYGADVFATSAGKITAAEYRGAYGNMVEIDHGLGVSTRYGHLSKIGVEVGQQIAKGEAIGVQGSTGRSTGPHVHYEVRYNDRPLNPAKFLSAGKLYVSQNQ